MTDSGPERARERATHALELGDVARALTELEALSADVEGDPHSAALALDLFRLVPQHPQLEVVVGRIVARWASDPQLITRACDALIRRCELTPADEPTPERERLARVASEAADRCLESLGADREPELRAFLLASRGNALRVRGDYEPALDCLQRASNAFPQRGGFWFNLGLLHKARHAWRDGLSANLRARELLGDERGVLWNLAICAIAVGEGAIAVDALRALGHKAELSEGKMPFMPDLPPVGIRVATLGSGLAGSAVPDRSVSFESLWVTALSPCHGVVSSPSYREASVDYGDVVLWDGVPVSVSEHAGRRVPRFPLLAVLRKGDEHRLRFLALQQASGQVEALSAELGEGAHLFVQRERIERFCARCASGEIMQKHVHEPAEEHRLVQGKLVLEARTDLPGFRRHLDSVLQRHSGVQLVVPRLLELVGDTRAAGVAHRLWHALGRNAV